MAIVTGLAAGAIANAYNSVTGATSPDPAKVAA
jgi:hypothetical protein